MAGFRARVTDVALDAAPARPRPGDARPRSRRSTQHRLLCAHREGPYGVGGWNRLVERLVAERTGVTHYEEWYAGRPILVTANDYDQLLNNGDMGVTIRRGRRAAAGRRTGGRRCVGVRHHPPLRRARRCTR